jgi:hypothetical protein
MHEAMQQLQQWAKLASSTSGCALLVVHLVNTAASLTCEKNVCPPASGYPNGGILTYMKFYLFLGCKPGISGTISGTVSGTISGMMVVVQ